jgi:hypothetical protein
MRSFFNLLLLLTFVIVLSGSLSYAQEEPESSAVAKSDSTLGIKIISPPNDKRVPEGSLTILGTSTDNENMNCTVYVDWNDLKPFQMAKATGPYGKDDFSSWIFTYSSSYHNIINGTNNLTSKIECQEGSILTSKWNSINVTGVRTEESRSLRSVPNDSVDSVKILPQLSSHVKKVIVNESSEKLIKPAASQKEPVINMMHTNVKLANPVVTIGDSQSIVVKAVDAKSFRQIPGAKVQIRMTDGIKNIEHPGVTDPNGVYNYSWPIDPNSKPGSYKVAVNVTSPGYRPTTHETIFQVQPRELLVQVNISKGTISPGDSQSIVVKAVDAKSFRQIPGAKVQIRMTDGVKNIEHPGVTDSNGVYNYSWPIDPNSKPGSYKVAADVSPAGYRSIIDQANFQIQGHLLAQVNLAKGVINPGDSQAITINVLDAITKQKVSDANVSGIVSGSKKFTTATNANGQAKYTWTISPISGGKAYNVTVDVSHDKYSSLSKSVTFKTGKPMNLLGPSDEDNLGLKLKMQSTPVTSKEQCKKPGPDGQSTCNENSLVKDSKELVAFKESTSSPIFG